jgi:hypothetical protein
MVRPSLVTILEDREGNSSSVLSFAFAVQGYGDKAVKWPRKCFNALNHWQLGVSSGRQQPSGVDIVT